MNCLPTIAIALLLLSLTGGMFLLYKTQKEALGIFFKIISWLIILVSIGAMICCSICCVCRQQCKMEEGECGPGYNNECVTESRSVMIKGEEECDYEKEEGCCKAKMNCEEEVSYCKKGAANEYDLEEKKEIKKDTIVIKK